MTAVSTSLANIFLGREARKIKGEGRAKDTP